jgi:hypothetical protein
MMNFGDGESQIVELSPAFPYQGHFSAHIPARLVLIPVVSPRQHSAALVPDNLLRIEESESQQAVEYFAGVDRSVPYATYANASDHRVRREARLTHQCERLRPSSAGRVETPQGYQRRDRRVGVALGAVLHVAALDLQAARGRRHRVGPRGPTLCLLPRAACACFDVWTGQFSILGNQVGPQNTLPLPDAFARCGQLTPHTAS